MLKYAQVHLMHTLNHESLVGIKDGVTPRVPIPQEALQADNVGQIVPTCFIHCLDDECIRPASYLYVVQ